MVEIAMPSKRIIVLANSIKKSGRCVAGREIAGDARIAGDWIRPISDVDEGTLYSQHMVIDTGEPLEVLDIVDVPVIANANDPCHPEDWKVSSRKWHFFDTFDPDKVDRLAESPKNLWLGDVHHPDRVASDYLLRNSGHQSLYLIRPKSFRIRLWREFNQYKGRNQKYTRAVFTFRGTEYNLGLTDPVITENHCATFPDVDEPAREMVLPFADQCLLCVSLTPVFNGYHYKVVATVLELS